MAEVIEHPDSFKIKDEPKSSQHVLDALADAKREFQPYWHFCDRIDRLISASGLMKTGVGYYYSDQEFDLFWASMEILKPAVYAKPPQPVVTPRFSDRDKVATTASELLERCLSSSFERGDFDQVMLNVRDDLCIAARGVSRVTYEDDSDGGKRVCDEHVDRVDFLHEPARKWSEVGWVGFAAYMTEREYVKRFPNKPKGSFNIRAEQKDDYIRNGEMSSSVDKCKVWEVWHKADNRVYWVTDGVDEFLDEKSPFLKLEGFFPCPRPAYGVLKRRSMIPVPDYVRYERHLEQINILTGRIYNLLDWIRVKGFFPGGGDQSKATELMLAQSQDDVVLVPVPGAAMTGDASNFVQFLPLEVFANTIKGLLEARRELINNFYELSGISDIMRGATEAQETLGAQQLKSQYGSIRVKDKVDELQRLARDVARISAEIIAEKFDQDTLLEMAQMTLPTRAELKKKLKELESSAEKEMAALEKKAVEAAAQAQAQGQEIDPQQAEQQFQQAQQQVIQKYQEQIKQTADTVSIDDVMELLRDKKARAFTIEIETDSTIIVDEVEEKKSRLEFMQTFRGAIMELQPLMALGEAGTKLAGGMLKFALAPYRAGRELDGMIDDFVDEAPAAIAAQQEQGGVEKQMAEANLKIAEAEFKKAEASTAKVMADIQKANQDRELKAAEAAEKAIADQDRRALEMQKTASTVEETEARIQKIFAEIQKMGFDANITLRKEDREDAKTMVDIESRQFDQAMSVEDRQRQAVESDRNASLSERQQEFSERQGERAESRADRQQSFAERQAQQERIDA